MFVYLAGGFKSGWQDKLIDLVGPGSIRWVDPSKHELPDSKHYTLWDTAAIENADVIVAFMEDSNPAGYALAFEVGYAKALNKKVLLLDTKSPVDEKFARYFAMITESVDITVTSLEEMAKLVKRLSDAYRGNNWYGCTDLG